MYGKDQSDNAKGSLEESFPSVIGGVKALVERFQALGGPGVAYPESTRATRHA